MPKSSIVASFHPYFDLPNKGTEISRMFPFRSNGFVLINDDGRYAMPQFIENVNQNRSEKLNLETRQVYICLTNF